MLAAVGAVLTLARFSEAFLGSASEGRRSCNRAHPARPDRHELRVFRVGLSRRRPRRPHGSTRHSDRRPASIGAIAFHNKAAVYDLLFRTAAES
jgi:hypothetical protein